MTTDLQTDNAVSVTETGCTEPVANFPKMFPQIFTRKGEVRMPKAFAKNKDSMALKMKKFTAILRSFRDNVMPDAKLSILIPGATLVLSGNCMVEFIGYDDGAYLLDLIANGWYVYYA